MAATGQTASSLLNSQVKLNFYRWVFTTERHCYFKDRLTIYSMMSISIDKLII